MFVYIVFFWAYVPFLQITETETGVGKRWVCNQSCEEKHVPRRICFRDRIPQKDRAVAGNLERKWGYRFTGVGVCIK